MTRDELSRIFRRTLVGVAATPLFLLPGCGRSLPYEDLTVIPSLDSGRPDAGRDGGYDGGFDAGVDGGTDGGKPWMLKLSCTTIIDAGAIPVAECKTLCAPLASGQTVNGCWPEGDVLQCSVFCGVGRLADGVSASSEGNGLGRVLADMAAHEAAAVIAFEQLSQELVAHNLQIGRAHV